jgi:uncharacterized membrane protein
VGRPKNRRERLPEPGRRRVSKGRVEAFSDGVFAVAITLLALGLRVPARGAATSLAHRLALEWPSYLAYAVSFLTIGIIWINHHGMFRRVKAIDHAVLILNLLLLMTVCALPFTTALLSEYLDARSGAKVAAFVYGGSFLVMSMVFLTLQAHVMLSKEHLLDERLTPSARRRILYRSAAGTLPYVLATAGAVLSPYLTVGICAAMALFFALPPTTLDTEPVGASASARGAESAAGPPGAAGR